MCEFCDMKVEMMKCTDRISKLHQRLEAKVSFLETDPNNATLIDEATLIARQWIEARATLAQKKDVLLAMFEKEMSGASH